MTETKQVPSSTTRSKLQRLRVPLGFITAMLFIAGSQPTWPSLAIGIPIVFCGAMIRAWASGHLRKNAELAVSGPYAHTRNPLYFGSFMMSIGFAICGGNIWAGLLLIGLFLLVYLPVMRAEAEHMQMLFAEGYAKWAAAVPLFLPRLTPYASGQSRSFDLQQYLHHREYRALIGVAIIIGILVIKAVNVF